MGKRVISLLLTISMSFSLLTASAWGAELENQPVSQPVEVQEQSEAESNDEGLAESEQIQSEESDAAETVESAQEEKNVTAETAESAVEEAASSEEAQVEEPVGEPQEEPVEQPQEETVQEEPQQEKTEKEEQKSQDTEKAAEQKQESGLDALSSNTVSSFSYDTFVSVKTTYDENWGVGDNEYSFVPEYTGTYVIESYGSDDTVVYLRDSGGNILNDNDDGGSGKNFCLRCTLQAGVTYYIDPRFYEDAEKGDIYWTIVLDPKELTVSDFTRVNVTVDDSSGHIYRFVPSTSGTYRFISGAPGTNTDVDPKIGVYDVWQSYNIEQDDANTGIYARNYDLSVNLNAGEVYYIDAGVLGRDKGSYELYVGNAGAFQSISGAAVSLSQYTYANDYTAKTPDVSVNYNGMTLTQGTDFLVSYTNNDYIGTATATVYGIGRYVGSVSTNFTIYEPTTPVDTTPPHVSVDQSSVSMISPSDTSRTIVVTASNKNFTRFWYETSNRLVCLGRWGTTVENGDGSVSNTLTLSAIGAGDCTVTVRLHDANDNPIDTVTIPVHVSEQPRNNKIQASNVKRNFSTKAQKFNLNAYANGVKLKYKSNNKNVKVSGSGKVTVSKGFLGKAKIKITSEATSRYLAASKTITVTVAIPKPNMSLASKQAGQLTISWKQVGSVDGYELQIFSGSSFKMLECGPKKKRLTGRSFKSKSTVNVRMRAFKKSGKKRIYGAWSAKKKVRVK